jgi:hypothetical protein
METVRELPFEGRVGSQRSDGGAARVFHETRPGWVVLGTVWALSVAYLAFYLSRGWAPVDAGTLAEMARRAWEGQVPHRDFLEIYTGGLTYLNAFAFRLFGVNLFSLRIPLFLFFLGWAPSVYLIARRFTGPFASGSVTLLAVAWSVPNYPEAMPSWYVLFFATWGALALIRYTEAERRRWLFISGLCGGLSFLVKSPGLYFVAAALLFLVFRERSQAPASVKGSGLAGILYRSFITFGLLLFVAVVARLVSTRPTLADVIQFLLPSAVLAGFVLWETWTREGRLKGSGFRELMATGLSFLGGVLAPMLLFAAWYMYEGALGALLSGVFVQPFGRTLWTAWEPFSPLAGLAGLLPTLLIVLFAYDVRGSTRRWARVVMPLMLIGLLVWARVSMAGYIFVGYSVQLAVPLLGLAVPFVLRRTAGAADLKRQQGFLLVSVLGICALIEFPMASTIYFCFIAPLVILAAMSLLSTQPSYDGVLMGSLLAFYFVFALWIGVPGYFAEMRSAPSRPLSFQRLDLPRAGGIRVSAEDAETYEKLIPLVQAHAKGRDIYCTVDCPVLYFLSGLGSPTGNIFGSDFFGTLEHAEGTLETLDEHGVRVVVFAPFWAGRSVPIPVAVRELFDARFPRSEMVGGFEVRWR